MSNFDHIDDVVQLCQDLIRNKCVNDGSVESGQEIRNVETLQDYLGSQGFDMQTFESASGRTSLLCQIQGSDPKAASLMLMCHSDVVPANASRWKHDPYGGELIDGEIWGRGAIDMLNLTASMAVAFRHIALGSSRPKGTVSFLVLADEEAGGQYGAAWLDENHPEVLKADYLVSEMGGVPLSTSKGLRLPVSVSDKGLQWWTIKVKGEPGHGSRPFKSDNAIVKAAEIIRRIHTYRAKSTVSDIWDKYVQAMDFPLEAKKDLVDPKTIWRAIEEFPIIEEAKIADASTHITISPNIIHGGIKTNVIPDEAVIEVDIRTLPGQGSNEVRQILHEIIGELISEVELVQTQNYPASSSPIDTPLWNALAKISNKFYPNSQLLPVLTVGITDTRFFRQHGSVGYGFGMFSQKYSKDQYSKMFHGDNERIDIESLKMSSKFWELLVQEMSF